MWLFIAIFLGPNYNLNYALRGPDPGVKQVDLLWSGRPVTGVGYSTSTGVRGSSSEKYIHRNDAIKKRGIDRQTDSL